jgi:hypothetical protein
LIVIFVCATARAANVDGLAAEEVNDADAALEARVGGGPVTIVACKPT